MRYRGALAALGMLAAGAVACSGSADPPPCPRFEATSSVTMADFSYTPACIGTGVGASLQLDNRGEAPHTFTVEGSQVSVDVPAGEQASADLGGLSPGTYTVICTYHPQMKATLEVG
jgi:plastocyanin